MTIQELSKYYYLKMQIKSIKLQIKELNDSILSSIQLTGLPSSNNVSNPVQKIIIKKSLLENKLNIKMVDMLKQLEIIEDYIDTVDDERIKLIIRYRFIELLSWEEIGNNMHYERTTPYQALKKYLKERMNYEKEVEKCL